MQIRLERNAYYDILEAAQKGELDITGWLKWFLGCLDRAIEGAEDTLSGVLQKDRFWEEIKGQLLNDRQRKVIKQSPHGVSSSARDCEAFCRDVACPHEPERPLRIRIRSSEGFTTLSFKPASIVSFNSSSAPASPIGLRHRVMLDGSIGKVC